MKKFTLCSALIVIVMALFPAVIMAQWNTNTSVNTLIATVPIADMQSVSTTDAKTWVAFYHQNGANYDMRAQLFDANGNKLLGTDGVLVSNQTSGSATYVFNVCVDASNNLVIGYQDNRTGSSSAVVYKISQTGTQLWGATGIVLGAGLSPYPALLSNGEIAVAWNESGSNTINIQKITTSGTLAWGTPISVTVGSSLTTRGQIIGNLGGKFTMVYQKRGIGISTTLYAQMFSNTGTALYSALQIGSLTTSGARYYSIAAEGDTTYFGYYAASGSRFNSYLQRINPSGTIPWGMNGSNFNTSTAPADNYQMTTSIAIAPGSNNVWSVCTFSDFNQVQYGVYVQKFNKNTGARLFTDNAKVVYGISAATDQLAGPIALVNDTPMFMTYDNNYKIYATRLDANGNFSWPGNRVEISSTTASMANGKMRYGFTPDGPNRCAGVWTENRTGSYQGFAQGISVGGLTGVVVSTQGSVPAVITTSGGSLQLVATVFPATASQSVTWSMSFTGTGQATINSTGLVTAIANGTVYARATSVQDPSVRDSLMITISNQGPLAPAVTTLAASNIVTTTATLNGNVTANGASTSVSFQWGTTTAYGNTATGSPATVTGTGGTGVSANISSLIVGTTYHYRCVGTNTAGTTNGNDMTFVAGCTPLTNCGPVTGPSSVCNNASGVVYSIPALTGATGYTWTVPSGAMITAGNNTNSITVTFGTTGGTVSVFATNTCSNSSPASMTVSITPPPVPTITGSNSACENSAAVLYSTEAGMTNYTWTVSAGGTISSGAGTNAIQVLWTATGPQTVSVNYTGTSGCQAVNPTSYPVSVSAMPGTAGAITGTAELCAGTSNVEYSCDSIPFAMAYIWTLPAGATIVSGNNTNHITVNFAPDAVSGNILVNGNNLCGNGPASPAFMVTVNPIPPTPVVTLLGFTLSSSAPTGNQWYVLNGSTGVPIQGETGQTMLVTSNGKYYTIVTLNGCSSVSSDTLLVIIEGIDEAVNSNVQIYPVPSEGIFTVKTIKSFGDVKVTVTDITGTTIFETTMKSNEKEIDLRNLPEGVYSVGLTGKDLRVNRKIIIRR